MKLIDLLVQELPKRGGWPEGAVECCRHYGTNSIDFYDETGNWDDDCYLKYGKDFAKDCVYEETLESHRLQSISRNQYESALTASQKLAWNGEGLPPVGYECECQFLDAWHTCKVLFVGAEVIVGVIDGSERAFSVSHTKFRPFQSEAERKRDAAIEAMQREADEGDNWIYSEYEIIYDAIAAGKIPGVKLED
ncbi:hypothetical protein KGB51_gp49 [Escherichia phage C1]|uniref:Uncharacterized protein n=2 Tax=root TaxID=1 RepID=A0A3G3M879_9CAUD|nr:hypothetical protein KGB51_gp49 [Escherichia phage C1]AYR02297.1 hypothetical protein [Escherichia phage C1]URP83708.1 hypothetical protein [Escherichia phage S192]